MSDDRVSDDGIDIAVARLNGVISPLRRGLLRAARTTEHLPDIPDAQIEVLRALPEGGSRAPAELAAELGLSRSTISNLLRTMEAADLVTRRAAPEDGRSVEVRASARAIRLLDRFDAASTGLLAGAVAELTDDERAALIAALPALDRLRDAVQSAAHEPRATAAASRRRSE